MNIRLDVKLEAGKLAGLGPETHRRLVRAIEETAEEIVRDAKGRAPVLSGALRDSIHREPAGELSDQVVAEVPYAVFVEYGTARAPAQPFLTPAHEAAKPGFYRRLAEAIRAAAGG